MGVIFQVILRNNVFTHIPDLSLLTRMLGLYMERNYVTQLSANQFTPFPELQYVNTNRSL